MIQFEIIESVCGGSISRKQARLVEKNTGDVGGDGGTDGQQLFPLTGKTKVRSERR